MSTILTSSLTGAEVAKLHRNAYAISQMCVTIEVPAEARILVKNFADAAGELDECIAQGTTWGIDGSINYLNLQYSLLVNLIYGNPDLKLDWLIGLMNYGSK